MTFFDVVEYKGFGVQECRTVENDRKTFHTLREAIIYLDENRKDKGLSWASWETPYTYEIQSHNDSKFIKQYTSKEIKDITEDIKNQ